MLNILANSLCLNWAHYLMFVQNLTIQQQSSYNLQLLGQNFYPFSSMTFNSPSATSVKAAKSLVHAALPSCKIIKSNISFCTTVLLEDWYLAQMRSKCFGEVVEYDAEHKLEQRPVDAPGVVVPRDLMNFSYEPVVILILDGPDHGANGVHHPHTMLLQVRVRLHVAKVLGLHTGVGSKEAEKRDIFHILILCRSFFLS